MAYSLGVSINIDPKTLAPFFVRAETRYAEKGYRTQIDEGSTQRDFQLKFHYLYQSFAAAYQLTPQISPYVGLELGVLAYTQLKADTQSLHLKDTYQPVDLGILAGVQFFSSAWVSADIRASSSLLPVLYYDSFDQWGNPTKRLRGIIHLSLETAVLFRLFKFRYQQ